MSFRCDHCHQSQPAGSKPNRVIVETRAKHYPKRYAADEKTVIDNGGYGYETAKEEDWCNKCISENG